jgi:hypothetical protein
VQLLPRSGFVPWLTNRLLKRTRLVRNTIADRTFEASAGQGALDGISSPAGSCVWHVVGLQGSVREWAIRQGWGGRPVRQEQAQGILVAALGVLAAHLGY